MAKKEMLISVCDRCDKEVMTETAKYRKNELMIPTGWIHVSIKSKNSDLIAMDLCNDCSVPVLKAAHKGDVK